MPSCLIFHVFCEAISNLKGSVQAYQKQSSPLRSVRECSSTLRCHSSSYQKESILGGDGPKGILRSAAGKPRMDLFFALIEYHPD